MLPGCAERLVHTLLRVELEIATSRLQQFLVRAHLNDVTIVDEYDPVGVSYRRQPMGDDKTNSTRQHAFNPMLNSLLCFGIDRTGGLVQDEYLGRSKNCSRERQQLFLAGREPITAFANLGVIAALKPGYELVGFR